MSLFRSISRNRVVAGRKNVHGEAVSNANAMISKRPGGSPSSVAARTVQGEGGCGGAGDQPDAGTAGTKENKRKQINKQHIIASVTGAGISVVCAVSAMTCYERN
jgi:hypothetical protein